MGRFKGFEQYLNPGETILWQGKNEKGDFSLASKLTVLFIGLIAAAVATAVWVLSHDYKAKTWSVYLYIFAAMLIAHSVIVFVRKNDFTEHYAFTQRRILTYTNGFISKDNYNFYEIVSYPSAVASAKKKNGFYDVTLMDMSDKEMVLTNVKEGEKAVSVLRQQINNLYFKEKAEAFESVVTATPKEPEQVKIEKALWHGAVRKNATLGEMLVGGIIGVLLLVFTRKMFQAFSKLPVLQLSLLVIVALIFIFVIYCERRFFSRAKCVITNKRIKTFTAVGEYETASIEFCKNSKAVPCGHSKVFIHATGEIHKKPIARFLDERKKQGITLKGLTDIQMTEIINAVNSAADNM